MPIRNVTECSACLLEGFLLVLQTSCLGVLLLWCRSLPSVRGHILPAAKVRVTPAAAVQAARPHRVNEKDPCYRAGLANTGPSWMRYIVRLKHHAGC